MKLLILIQILHILSGTIWLCSFIFMYFILWPTFVKNNSKEALILKEDINKYGMNILGIAGSISITLGFIRGIFFSGMNNWNSLSTLYGRYFISAILISILMIVIGRIYGHNLVTIPWEDEASKNKSLTKIYLAGSFILLCYVLLLFCMVAMRFGGI